MTPNITIETNAFHGIGDLLTSIISQFEYLANVTNMSKDEPFEEFPKQETILDHYSEFISTTSILNHWFDFKINRRYTHIPKVEHIEYLLSYDQQIDSYRSIPEVLRGVVKNENSTIFLDILKEFLFSWSGYTNYRMISTIVEKSKDSTYSNLLKLSIWNEIETLKTSGNLKEILEPLLWSYYYGYTIGNKVFQNLFYGKIRLYLNKEKLDNPDFTEKQFIEIFRDVDITSDSTNELLIKESYLILIKFIKSRIKENKILESETDIYLLHSKLDGLLRLVRILHGEYSIINENPILTNLKDFYEEIHCDCGALKKHKEHRYLINPPKYIHWILKISLFPKENISSYESLMEYSKQRIFLSERVHNYISKNITKESTLTIEEIKEIGGKVSQRYSDYDHRVIVPLYFLFKYDYTVLTNNLYSFEKFSQLCTEKNILEKEEDKISYYQFIQNIYLDKFKLDEIKEEEAKSAAGVHYTVSIRQLVNKINQSDSSNYEDSKSSFEAFIENYPYCGFAYHELAILEDNNGNHEEAFNAIANALIWQPEDKIKWDSFFVIIKNILT